MKPLIVVDEFEQSFKDKILSELKRRFGIELETVNFILTSSLPRYTDYTGKVCFELSKYKEYKLITDYYPIKADNVIQIPDIEDVGYIVEVIAGFHIKPKVWFTDELEMTKKMIAKLPDVFAYDIESMGTHTDEEIAEAKEKLVDDPDNLELIKIARSNALMPPYNKCTMHSFSLDHERSFVLISTPEIEEYILDFLTTTDKKVVMHNMGFDGRFVYNRTGKHIKNYEDTQLISQSYENSVNQPLYGLKSLASHINPTWGSEKSSFDLYEDSTDYVNENLVYRGSNPRYKEYNLPLVFYAGIDTQMTHILWHKYSEINPEWESIDIDNLLPRPEPRDVEYSPRFFYENVLKPIIPVMIELTETPMPIDMSIIAKIKQDALNKREPAMERLKNYPAVKQYMEGIVKQKIEDYINPMIQKNQLEDASPKVYKHTPKHRTMLVNSILGTNEEKWSIRDLKTKIEELKEEP